MAEGGGGAAANQAVVGATATGEHSGDRIAQPSLEGEIAGQVAVTDYRLYCVVIVANHHIAKLTGDVRQGVLMHLPHIISPGKVGHRFVFFST